MNKNFELLNIWKFGINKKKLSFLIYLYVQIFIIYLFICHFIYFFLKYYSIELNKKYTNIIIIILENKKKCIKTMFQKIEFVINNFKKLIL